MLKYLGVLCLCGVDDDNCTFGRGLVWVFVWLVFVLVLRRFCVVFR